MIRNIEGFRSWDAVPRKRLVDGVSAIVRVKDEEDFLALSLESIRHAVDEIVIAVQGPQTDKTAEVAHNWLQTFSGGRQLLFYPFDSHPNGPGHDKWPIDSVFDRAYFYNWCKSKATRNVLLKWDGDQIALDGFDARTYVSMGYARFWGAEIVLVEGRRLWVSDEHPRTSSEVMIFPNEPWCKWEQGTFCERFVCPVSSSTISDIGEKFLHFKWVKRRSSARTAWPDNWMNIPHFTRIERRAQPGLLWGGKLPEVVEGRL